MSDAMLGEIRMFAGPYTPKGWSLCDGAILPISKNQALFSLIGTTYGGNGHETFWLPDLVGRLPVGMGQAPGRESYKVGSSGGSEAVILERANTPAHSHMFYATNAPANTKDPNGALPATVTPEDGVTGLYATPAGPNVIVALADQNFLDYAYGVETKAAPHANVMPAFGLNFIICISGIYPTRP